MQRLLSLGRDRSVREAFVSFALTRGIIGIIFLLAGGATLDRNAATFDPEDPHPVVWLDSATIAKQWQHTIARGDATWYMTIAEDGYERRPFEASQPHNWVFFPLYPSLVGWVGRLTGAYLFVGSLLSSALFFVALVLLHKLVESLGYDTSTAARSVFYTAAFPVSYFFSLPVTESLFLCLNVAAFLAAARNRWWAAGLLGGFASATRLSGILLLPTLGVFYWMRRPIGSWKWDVLWLALIPSGLLMFMVFMWRITGNPVAFIDAIAPWQRKSGFFLLPLVEYLRHPKNVIEAWDFRTLNFLAASMALAAAAFWLQRKNWAFAALTFMAIFLPLSSMRLQSLARYTSVIFPVFIALAIFGRHPRIDQAVRVIFIATLAVMTLCYALRFSFASA